jgi:hypothetical protein
MSDILTRTIEDREHATEERGVEMLGKTIDEMIAEMWKSNLSD